MRHAQDVAVGVVQVGFRLRSAARRVHWDYKDQLRKKMAGQTVHLNLSAKVAKPPKKAKEKKLIENPSFSDHANAEDKGEALGFPKWAMWLIAVVVALAGGLAVFLKA